MGQTALREFPSRYDFSPAYYPPEVVVVSFLDDALLPVDMSGDDMFSPKVSAALKALGKPCAATAERVRELLWSAACESHAQNSQMFQTLQDQVDSEARFAGKQAPTVAPTGPQDIMASVVFKDVHVISSTAPDGRARLLIGVMGECSWDAEYGVAVLFDEAGRLVSAGGA